MGEPGVVFRVMPSDEAARKDLRAVYEVRSRISDRIIPETDLVRFFGFRGESERTGLNEPEWAAARCWLSRVIYSNKPIMNKDGENPTQASLRRAVSTAYYALFHFLIDEAVGNWGVVRQRSILARSFEHSNMKRVTADYDNSVVWTRIAAETCVDLADEAFEQWREIRTQDEAQDFLLRLFLPKVFKP